MFKYDEGTVVCTTFFNIFILVKGNKQADGPPNG